MKKDEILNLIGDFTNSLDTLNKKLEEHTASVIDAINKVNNQNGKDQNIAELKRAVAFAYGEIGILRQIQNLPKSIICVRCGLSKDAIEAEGLSCNVYGNIEEHHQYSEERFYM